MPVLKALIAGQWVEVSGGAGGTGSDEVFIQPDDPITLNPTAELWYDTDAVAPAANPVAEIFYSEITATVPVIVTSPATAISVINPGNVTYDGTPILLEFYATLRLPSAANAQLIVNLFDGNTDLGYWIETMNPAAGGMYVPGYLARRITPTPGTHNYNVRAWASTAIGCQVIAGTGGPATDPPAFLRATRVLQGGGTIAPPQSGLDVNRPAAGPGYAGLRYFATDTLRDWLCDGTGWIIMSEPVITSFVPTFTPLAGTFTTLGGVAFRYSRSAGILTWAAQLNITTNGTASTNISMTLPIAQDSALIGLPLGTGRENQAVGTMLNIIGQGGTTAWIQTYANAYPGGNGYSLGMGGSYRMASRYT
jgi:hypothetical protein